MRECGPAAASAAAHDQPHPPTPYPPHAASWFGPEAAAYAASLAAPRKLPGGGPNPEAFWVLEGYEAAYRALHAGVEKLIAKWSAQARRSAAAGCAAGQAKPQSESEQQQRQRRPPRGTAGAGAHGVKRLTPARAPARAAPPRR